MKSILKLSQVFLVGWLLNLLWENIHVFLYKSYRGIPFAEMGQVEKFTILLQASIFDGTFIVIAILSGAVLSLLFKPQKRELITISFAIGAAISFAIGLEQYALETGRWMYNDLMPIIPFSNVGLSPTIQLAITSYIAYRSAWRS